MKNEQDRAMQDWVMIEREFDVSIDIIWNMWTNPELFKQWYGPKGISVSVAEMDLKTGGTRKICMEMKSPKRNMNMWFTGIYKEIENPTRLVYTESMCDEDGNILAPSNMDMPEGHPDVTEVIVELSGDNSKTRMKMVHVGVPEGTVGADGWQQAFDKLSELLRS